MLGYHVHEKAILVAILSYALDLAKSPQSARTYLRLSIVGHYSLLPLIFMRKEYTLKVGLCHVLPKRGGAYCFRNKH